MTKKISLGLIAFGLVALCGTIGLAGRTKRGAEAAIADLANKQAALQAARVRAHAAIARADRVAAALQAQLEQLGAGGTTRAEGETAPEKLLPDDSLILATHPALRAKFEQSVRGGLAGKYATLFRRLNLSAEQSEKILGLMIRDAENELDLQGAVQERGLKMTDPAAAKLRERQIEALHAAEQAVLGAEYLSALQQFERVDGVRDGVERLCRLTLFSASPITGPQIEQLTQVFAEASRSYRSGGRAAWEGMDWDQALAGAAALLSKTQLAPIRAYAGMEQVAQQGRQFFGQPTK